MRITNSVMVNNMMKHLQNNIKKLDKYNEQLASGKQFQLPSEDPIGAVTSMGFNSLLKSNEQYLRNVDQAKNWLHNTESALNNAGKILQRARELAVYGANGSLSQVDMDAIAEEVAQLKDELIDVANTKFGDRYLFSGQKTDTPAFDENGNFTGDNNSINREIGPGITMQVNTDGQVVFEDAIDALENLYTNLTNGNSAAISTNDISAIDDALNINIRNRAEIGAKVNRLDLTVNRLEDEKLHSQELLSKNEDVDIAEVITELKMQESVYRASLAVGARIMQPTLVDFLE